MKEGTGESTTGERPGARRVPLERQIDLNFSNFEGLVTRVSANLSTRGMFIQTKSPEAPGTEFAFSIRIEDWSPIKGTAEVVWLRPQSEGPERPAGMGVKFVDLDAQSRRMIRWLVDKHLQDGGRPFDLETVPVGASKYGGRRKSEETDGGRAQKAAKEDPGVTKKAPALAAGSADIGGRIRRWAVALLVLAVVGAVGYFGYMLWQDFQPGMRLLRPPAADPGEPEATTGSAGAASSGESSAAPTLTSASREAVASFIQTWAATWEARQAAAVIAMYSPEFDAAPFGGRNRWETDLQRRLDGSEFIRFAVSGLEISFPEASTATATFYRSYRSDTENETRRMMLELQPDAAGWRILRERYLD